MCATTRRTFEPRFHGGQETRHRRVLAAALSCSHCQTRCCLLRERLQNGRQWSYSTFSNDVEFRVSALWKKSTPTPVSSENKRGCHHFTNEQLGLSARGTFAGHELARNTSLCRSDESQTRRALRVAGKHERKLLRKLVEAASRDNANDKYRRGERHSRSDHNFADHFQIVRAVHAQYRRGGKSTRRASAPALPSSPTVTSEHLGGGGGGCNTQMHLRVTRMWIAVDRSLIRLFRFLCLCLCVCLESGAGTDLEAHGSRPFG